MEQLMEQMKPPATVGPVGQQTPVQRDSRFEDVGVIGCGLMGAGIAEVCARSGSNVVVIESSVESAATGLTRIRRSLTRTEAKKRLTGAGGGTAEEVLSHIDVVHDLEALADRTLVIEAIAEDGPAKIELFGRLDRVLSRDDAVMASNTSSIPIVYIGRPTTRPEQVIGIHFFNPAGRWRRC